MDYVEDQENYGIEEENEVDVVNLDEDDENIDETPAVENANELPESQRADAVSSMVYEANARLRDPVYGCAGSICQLQKQVSDLQAQLAKAQAEVVNLQCQQANLMALICMEMNQSPQASPPQQSLDNFINTPFHQHFPMSFLDDNNNFGSVLETLWT
ncbi:LOB domain-containing protein 1 [Capsicum annuum]|uniref:LOB domain-containing protein 1 n=1 Tax=Capsicum annuum TaxID=4072 RepID=A0A2G2YGP0_CAPAN|nr:LOB domain-containing protein 1 [Capsicum annuum]